MGRMRQAAVLASVVIFCGGIVQAANPNIEVRVLFPGNTTVYLKTSGTPPQGEGAMTNAQVRYPMKVTGGKIDGSYIKLTGTIKGSKVTVPFELIANVKSGYATWTAFGKNLGVGKGSIKITLDPTDGATGPSSNGSSPATPRPF